MTKKPHKTVRVRVGKEDEQIDVKIAPLIREIWKAGIETHMSCQDYGDGRIWIQFETIQLQEFLNIVCCDDAAGEGMRGRAEELGCKKDGWTYDFYLVEYHNRERLPELLDGDPGDDDAYNAWLMEPDFRIVANLFLPYCDLPTVLKRLRSFNKATKQSPKTRHSR